jgi:sporulation protein YlmC with PRC-barrel domain
MSQLNAIVACVLVALLGLAPPAALAESKDVNGEKSFSETLHSGIRASGLLNSRIFSRAGEHLGQVRNIVFSDDGSVKAIIAEQAGIGTSLEFVFRLPWDAVAQPVRPGALIANLSDARSEQFRLFGEKADHKGDAEFLATEVVGDYVRLQTGLGYGYVKDVVLAPTGRMIAVLVARDTPMGGGTLAFPFPGRTGRWSADFSYYGLPFVTVEQANDAAVRVDLKRFDPAG